MNAVFLIVLCSVHIILQKFGPKWLSVKASSETKVASHSLLFLDT